MHSFNRFVCIHLILINTIKIHYISFNTNIKCAFKTHSLLKLQLINIVYRINKKKRSKVTPQKSLQICING